MYTYHLRCIWLPLISMVLATPSDDRYRQTSKEINTDGNANYRRARALSTCMCVIFDQMRNNQECASWWIFFVIQLVCLKVQVQLAKLIKLQVTGFPIVYLLRHLVFYLGPYLSSLKAYRRVIHQCLNSYSQTTHAYYVFPID